MQKSDFTTSSPYLMYIAHTHTQLQLFFFLPTFFPSFFIPTLFLLFIQTHRQAKTPIHKSIILELCEF